MRSGPERNLGRYWAEIRDWSEIMSTHDETATIEGTVERETDLAILIAIDGDLEHKEWIPKSQIEWESSGGIFKVGDSVEIEIPEWLAIEKGLA